MSTQNQNTNSNSNSNANQTTILQNLFPNVDFSVLTAQYGTPLYVYSKKKLLTQFNAYFNAAQNGTQIHYAVKANSNLSILKILYQAGAHFDVVSAGELKRVLAIACPADRVVFAGVGKSIEEINFALKAGVHCFNVESIAELERLQDLAEKQNCKAAISLRINPNVDANTHPYISTGLKENKFGIAYDQAINTYQRAATMSHIVIKGIDCHIGSQITQTAPFFEALDRLLDLVKALKTQNIHIEHLDIGGGLGIDYFENDQEASDIESQSAIAQYVQTLQTHLKAHDLKLILEPGRSIVGNAGVLITQVEYLKHAETKNFCIVDAAMNDLMRPTLYQAYHHIEKIKKINFNNDFNNDSENQTSQTTVDIYDIVGPVCESGDWLAKQRTLSNLQQGDYLAILSAGAYGFTMSSNYNTRARAAEVLVDEEGNIHLIRPREEIEALYQTELDFLI